MGLAGLDQRPHPYQRMQGEPLCGKSLCWSRSTVEAKLCGLMASSYVLSSCASIAPSPRPFRGAAAGHRQVTWGARGVYPPQAVAWAASAAWAREQQMARILVTGATRGLGRALVQELSRRDHEVVATGRRLADMADLPAAERLVLDLTDPASINAAMAVAGTLEVVINNAAMTVSGPVEAVARQPGRAGAGDQCPGTAADHAAALPTMRERGASHILNISSPAGRFAPPLGRGIRPKGALEMLSEAPGSRLATSVCR